MVVTDAQLRCRPDILISNRPLPFDTARNNQSGISMTSRAIMAVVWRPLIACIPILYGGCQAWANLFQASSGVLDDHSSHITMQISAFIWLTRQNLAVRTLSRPSLPVSAHVSRMLEFSCGTWLVMMSCQGHGVRSRSFIFSGTNT